MDVWAMLTTCTHWCGLALIAETWVTERCGLCSKKKKKKNLVLQLYWIYQITKEHCKILAKRLRALLLNRLLNIMKGNHRKQWESDLAQYTFGFFLSRYHCTNMCYRTLSEDWIPVAEVREGLSQAVWLWCLRPIDFHLFYLTCPEPMH